MGLLLEKGTAVCRLKVHHSEITPSAGVGSQGSTLSAVRPLPTIESDTVIKAEVQSVYSKLPLFFEVNQGQVDPQAKFLSRSSGSTLFFTDTQAVLILKQRSASSEQ